MSRLDQAGRDGRARCNLCFGSQAGTKLGATSCGGQGPQQVPLVVVVVVVTVTSDDTSHLPPRCKGGGRGRGWVTTVATGPTRGVAGGVLSVTLMVRPGQARQARSLCVVTLVNSKCRINEKILR